METLFSIMSNLQTHYHLKLDFKKWTNIQEASDKSTTPNTEKTISSKVWNCPVVYPSGEYNHNVFNYKRWQ